jgi:hypothetical protein
MELIQRIQKRYKAKVTTQFTENGQINEIYEYCIANILEQQAENLYNCISDVNLRETLIFDFIRMEKFRREDRFEDFCLAAFQQIEAMVNFVLKKYPEYKENCHRQLVFSAFSKYDAETQTWISKPGKTTGEFLFGGKFKNSKSQDLYKKFEMDIFFWEIFQRLKFIIYFHYYDSKMEYHFVQRELDLFLKLKNLRDLNHRNTNLKEEKKNEIVSSKNASPILYGEFTLLIGKTVEWTMNQGLGRILEEKKAQDIWDNKNQ